MKIKFIIRVILFFFAIIYAFPIFSMETQEASIIAVVELNKSDNEYFSISDDIQKCIQSALMTNRNFTCLEAWLVDTMLASQNYRGGSHCVNLRCVYEMGNLLSVNYLIGLDVHPDKTGWDIRLSLFDIRQRSIITESKKILNYSNSKCEPVAALTNELMASFDDSSPKMRVSGKSPDTHSMVVSDDRRSKKRKIILCSVLPPLVGGAAAGAYIYYSNNNNKNRPDGDPADSDLIPMNDAPVHTRD